MPITNHKIQIYMYRIYNMGTVFDMKGWRRKPLRTMGLLNLLSSTHLVVTGELTHTIVPYAHTVVICVVKGRGGNL